MSTQPVPPDQDHRELVVVFDTQQESEAMVVQGLLESAGIESMIANLDAPQDVLPGVGGVQVRVPPESEAEARSVIEAYRNQPEVELSEDAEADV